MTCDDEGQRRDAQALLEMLAGVCDEAAGLLAANVRPVTHDPNETQQFACHKNRPDDADVIKVRAPDKRIVHDVDVARPHCGRVFPDDMGDRKFEHSDKDSEIPVPLGYELAVCIEQRAADVASLSDDGRQRRSEESQIHFVDERAKAAAEYREGDGI